MQACIFAIENPNDDAPEAADVQANNLNDLEPNER